MITKQEFQKHIAERIKTLRLSCCLSQNEIAKRANINRTSITQIEGNHFMPTLYLVYKIARAFDITIDELVNL